MKKIKILILAFLILISNTIFSYATTKYDSNIFDKIRVDVQNKKAKTEFQLKKGQDIDYLKEMLAYLMNNDGDASFNVKGWKMITRGQDATVEYGYQMSQAQLTELDRFIEEVLQGKNFKDDFEKIKFVHDFIVSQYRYDTEKVPSTAYDIYIKGYGVCSGYTQLGKLFFDKLGIENKVVIGFAKEPHTWNMVKIGEKWYHVDITWDDPIVKGRENIGITSYEYFLISEDSIKKDHTFLEEFYPRAVEDYLVLPKR